MFTPNGGFSEYGGRDDNFERTRKLYDIENTDFGICEIDA